MLIAIYVDDLNLIGTSHEVDLAAKVLTDEFEMKDLGRTSFCIGQQVEHLPRGVFLHQKTYTRKVLKRFGMDTCYPLSTPMVVRTLDPPSKDPFRPREEGEEILGAEFPYLAAIGALMYLATNTRPDIAFAVNLLARFSSEPTRRHWKGVKDILRYLRGTEGLWFIF